MNKKLFTLLIIVLGALNMISCSKDSEVVMIDTKVNEQILDIMKKNYLWDLPAEPNVYLGIEPFFNSLLSKKNDTYTDQGNTYTYSRISAASSQPVIVYDPGFEYAINEYIYNGKVITYYVVLYVKPRTSAENFLSRGMYITTVNGTAVTKENASTLLYNAYAKGGNNEGVMGLMIRTPNIVAERAVTITPYPNYQEDPLYTSDILTVGAEKVGYILYNNFSTGPAGSKDYDYENALAKKLADFQNAGISNLVFDVRYNSGGSVYAVQSLGSALVKGRDESKAFIQQVFRPDLPTPSSPLNFRKDTQGGVEIPKLGDQLDKIYIITGQTTAGAPEALINALKEYRPVILVGETTKGRNVATATATENGKEPGLWNLRIAYSYLADASKNYDYSKGFTPDKKIAEVQANADINDNKNLLGKLGTKDEIILSQVLGMIGGTVSLSSVESRSVTSDREVKTSLSRRLGANETTVELN